MKQSGQSKNEEEVSWQLAGEIPPGRNAFDLSEDLKRFGLGEGEFTRFHQSLAERYPAEGIPGIKVYLARKTAFEESKKDSMRFFIVTPGEDVAGEMPEMARYLELYLY